MVALQIASPVIGAYVTATVVYLVIACNKNLSGAVAVAFGAALIGALGLFSVEEERIAEFVDEIVLEKKSGFYQAFLNLLQVDLKQVVGDAQMIRRYGAEIKNSLNTGKAFCGRIGLMPIRMRFVKKNLSCFNIPLLHVVNPI